MGPKTSLCQQHQRPGAGPGSNDSFLLLAFPVCFSKWLYCWGAGWRWRGAQSHVRNPVMRNMKGKHKDITTATGQRYDCKSYRWQLPSWLPPRTIPKALDTAERAGHGLWPFHLLDRYASYLPESPKDTQLLLPCLLQSVLGPLTSTFSSVESKRSSPGSLGEEC